MLLNIYKKFFYFIFFIIIYSCSQPKLEGYSFRIIELKHSNGKINIMLPNSLDTSHPYIFYGDNSCDNSEGITFLNHNYLIFPDTIRGFAILDSSSYNDTILSLTITYHIYSNEKQKQNCEGNNISPKISLSHLEKFDSITYGKNYKSVSKREIKTINGREFIIREYKSYFVNKGKDQQQLKAFTTINGSTITFDCECYAKNCNDFIEKMKKSINSIDIVQ